MVRLRNPRALRHRAGPPHIRPVTLPLVGPRRPVQVGPVPGQSAQGPPVRGPPARRPESLLGCPTGRRRHLSVAGPISFAAAMADRWTCSVGRSSLPPRPPRLRRSPNYHPSTANPRIGLPPVRCRAGHPGRRPAVSLHCTAGWASRRVSRNSLRRQGCRAPSPKIRRTCRPCCRWQTRSRCRRGQRRPGTPPLRRNCRRRSRCLRQRRSSRPCSSRRAGLRRRRLSRRAGLRRRRLSRRASLRRRRFSRRSSLRPRRSNRRRLSRRRRRSFSSREVPPRPLRDRRRTHCHHPRPLRRSPRRRLRCPRSPHRFRCRRWAFRLCRWANRRRRHPAPCHAGFAAIHESPRRPREAESLAGQIAQSTTSCRATIFAAIRRPTASATICRETILHPMTRRAMIHCRIRSRTCCGHRVARPGRISPGQHANRQRTPPLRRGSCRRCQRRRSVMTSRRSR
jgi:hypothetical protein